MLAPKISLQMCDVCGEVSRNVSSVCMCVKCYNAGYEEGVKEARRWCPCGDVILADTEDWPIQMCYECSSHFKLVTPDKQEV